MEIWDLFFNKNEREVLSFIGTGGKTTLIRKLAKHYRNKKKVLLTGTVDMERIPENELDFIDYEYTENYSLNVEKKNGVYLLSSLISNDNQLRGITIEEADFISPSFDLSLVECDMSWKRPLKAWRDNEPIIPKSTTCTICLLDIGALKAVTDVLHVHNLDIFMDITGNKLGEEITMDDIALFYEGENSIFKRTQGRTILFINKVESLEDEKVAKKFAARLNIHGPQIIISGSLKLNEYRILKVSSLIE